jgi:hypothetical protein
MDDYKFFSISFMNDKLVIAVLCFGSYICNQAARIRVKMQKPFVMLLKNADFLTTTS